MSKARELANLGNAYSDGALSNRNLIINGAFRVSQRGDYTSASTMTHNVYMLDRWKNAAGVASTIQDLGGYIEIKATAASGASTTRISQLIEDLYLLEGQTVTVSCEMKSNSSNGRLEMHHGSWATTSAVHTGNGQWEKLSFTTTMPSSLTVTSVQVGIDGASSADVPISVGDYVQIKNVQLEVGDTATPFEHRSYGDELQRCQRYYEQIDHHTSYSYVGGTANGVSATYAYAPMFYNMKRAAPSITGNGDFVLYDGADKTVSGVTFQHITPQAASFRLQSTGLTAGRAYKVQFHASGTRTIQIDAEL